MNLDINEFILSDLQIGQTEKIDVSVTADVIDQFAKLSGDYSPVHIDGLFAKERGYADRIAHGMLIGSFISSLIGNRLPGRYGIIMSMEIEFKKPLIPPDTIQIEGKVAGISESVKQVLIKVTVSSGKGVLLATAKVRSIVAENRLDLNT